VAADTPIGALQKRRAELEAQIEDLKSKKASMPPDQYEAELERLLLELARVVQQIKAKS
jgi:cell division protein FtsB